MKFLLLLAVAVVWLLANNGQCKSIPWHITNAKRNTFSVDTKLPPQPPPSYSVSHDGHTVPQPSRTVTRGRSKPLSQPPPSYSVSHDEHIVPQPSYTVTRGHSKQLSQPSPSYSVSHDGHIVPQVSYTVTRDHSKQLSQPPLSKVVNKQISNRSEQKSPSSHTENEDSSHNTPTPSYIENYLPDTYNTSKPSYMENYSHDTFDTPKPLYMKSTSHDTYDTPTPSYPESYSHNTSESPIASYPESFLHDTYDTSTLSYKATESSNEGDVEHEFNNLTFLDNEVNTGNSSPQPHLTGEQIDESYDASVVLYIIYEGSSNDDGDDDSDEKNDEDSDEDSDDDYDDDYYRDSDEKSDEKSEEDSNEDDSQVAFLDSPVWRALMVLTATRGDMKDPNFRARWMTWLPQQSDEDSGYEYNSDE